MSLRPHAPSLFSSAPSVIGGAAIAEEVLAQAVDGALACNQLRVFDSTAARAARELARAHEIDLPVFEAFD